MKRKTFGKAAIASLLVATTMVGCTGAAFRPSASAGPVKGDPVKLAAAAERALADRDGAKAVGAAETLVQLAPQDAGYRQLLGRAYVQVGRFASAESALTDAMTLGNSDARTIVSLALVKVAQGRPDEARSLLASHADRVPASDYGLAMAMAGDAPEGVRILSEAIHDPSATARTRQNLAYAYALAGRWKDARLIAGMDMSPTEANKRISDWAQIAMPALAPQRVAALMGVTIDAGDQGLPTRLALAAPAQPAEAAPVELAQAQPDVPAPAADPLPAPVEVTAVEVAAPAAPVEAAPAPVAATAIAMKPVPPRPAAIRKPVAKMQQVAFLKPADSASNWVVQLGAYDTPAIAKEKWMGMAGRNSALAAFPVMTSQVTVKGKTFHRLAISGFGNRADATRACRVIQAQRGQCFVRETAPGATPQRWAIASRGRQFASR